MPFMDIKASCPVNSQQEVQLKSALGRAIALIPGKTESHLMLRVEDNCRMWFAGEQEGPIVMVEVAIYGSASAQAVSDFGREAVALIKKELGAAHVYLNLRQSTDWSY